jgi:hypothetical protein
VRRARARAAALLPRASCGLQAAATGAGGDRRWWRKPRAKPPPPPQQHHPSTPTLPRAGSGFGKSSAKKRVDTSKGSLAVPLPKQPKQQQPKQQQQQQQQQSAAAPAGVGVSGSGWVTLGKVGDLFTLEKPSRPIVLPSGVKICIYKLGNKVGPVALFCFGQRPPPAPLGAPGRGQRAACARAACSARLQSRPRAGASLRGGPQAPPLNGPRRTTRVPPGVCL